MTLVRTFRFRLSSLAFRALLACAALALIAGATYFAARWADRMLRANLLQQAHLVASAINPDNVAALNGAETDCRLPNYQRLKAQLAAVRAASPQCRYVYLMGRKADGPVFFFVDVQDDSMDNAPSSLPGEVYNDASAELRAAFHTGVSFVEGPLPDEWGTWVSALVPLTDPTTGAVLAMLGMDIDASHWTGKVVRQAALPAILAILAVLFGLFALLLRRGRRTLQAQHVELQENELRFVQITEKSRMFIWEADSQGLYVYLSPSVEAILGYRPEELVGRIHFFDLHPAEGSAEFKRVSLTAAAQKMPFLNLEHPMRTKDGKVLWFSSDGIPRLNDDGTLRGYRGSDSDITARKHAEAQVHRLLAESDQSRLALLSILEDQMRAEADRKRLATAIEQAAETIVVADAQGIIQYVNPAFEAITGYTREEALGQNPRILQSGQHDAAFYRQMWQTLLAGRTWRGRMVNKRKDGSLFTENAVISPVFDDSGQIINFVAVKHDVTEQLRLAEQLQQAQKLESIGRLAGGVAHDFNNMLQIILGSTEIAQLQTDLASPLQNELRDIQEASVRSIEIVQQLLAFARKQTIAPEVLDLNETTQGFLRMLQRLIGESIDLAWVPGADVWPIRMDPGQINQILANLCVNARDAIAGHGQITIATGNAAFTPERPSGHPPHATGEFVRLTVRDNGCGMDAKTLAHIYDPFFTTKSVGKGTGLGLSTVYGIVDQNGGFIDVESSPDRGTVFQVYLPRFSEGSGGALPAPAAKNAAGGIETVLVVEDEPAVLKQTARFLERSGYRVLAAESPEKALRLAQEHPDEIQLLLTDVVMPGMNGIDLVRTLRERQPDLRCLFMSGYTADLVAQDGVLDDGVNLIWKPFTRENLAAHVRNLLDL